MFPARYRRLCRLSLFLVGAALAFLPAAVAQKPASNSAPSPPRIAWFTDIAEKAGLTMHNIFGGLETKKYIIETTGTGVAIFDFDNDGWPDIFFVNSTTLEGSPAGHTPTNHLYRNNHDGTFTDVTEQAGLAGAPGPAITQKWSGRGRRSAIYGTTAASPPSSAT